MEFYIAILSIIFTLLWIMIGILALMKHENECATHRHSAPNLKYSLYGILMFSAGFRKRFKICDK